jgi:DNA-binding transcriptional MocR family regulator
MVAAMARYFPPQVQWSAPKGGFFVWVRLPAWASITDLYLAAIERQVAFAPGPIFFPGPPAYPALRVSFSQQPPERIVAGIERLGDALHEVLRHERAPESSPAGRVEMV